MKTTNILFWISTALIALMMLGAGVMDILSPDEVVAEIMALGFPDYFARPLGIFKVLGGIALLVPGFYRIKEWAYAGIAFDLIWAMIAHGSVGDEIGKVLFPLLPLVLLGTSYYLYHKRRMAAGVA